ncbi:hypothetical protein ACD591_19795 [Rufibacter glacialis]|uniref:Uncharacterized protein n=1 Tax=Rufibacter glacialis TaxID=1259555 RepID=A0A5M8Q4Z8_9BACT|nr:hypothetical protein [Rufibacter glacialis]KAA6430168.1 hypothetical protein FOE74_20320 [Rufibacter glacialis]GGK86930.1 hypothetical protein GCM10011405_38390 [Rufibacter glacialis]
MKNQFLIIVLIFLSFAVKAQKKELTISFEPSFAKHSILTITELGKHSTIILQTLEKDGSILKQEKKSVDKEEMKTLSGFLSSYEFKFKGSIDTLGTYETVRNGKKVTAHRISFGNDGITVKGKWQNDSTTNDFSFWSPQAGTNNHDLITRLFVLMDSKFKRNYTKQYLQSLKKYF